MMAAGKGTLFLDSIAQAMATGFHYPGQTRTKSPIKATFRYSSLRIPRFLDSGVFLEK